MNEALFWQNLQHHLAASDTTPELKQRQWEWLGEAKQQLTLPSQVLVETVCRGAVYFSVQTNLNFPAITPLRTLSASQTIALEMALSNSAIALISGVPATGKTRIATHLAEAAITHNKRILILTHHSATLQAYATLSGYPFFLSQSQPYSEWIATQLREKHFAQPQIDYLPPQFLPDSELAKLRTPGKLEKWLSLLSSQCLEQLKESLTSEFPYLSSHRLTLLADRLQQLEPLLQEQLSLIQLYRNLSETGILELAQHLAESPTLPILGTVAQWLQHPELWETFFDLVIIEEAESLSWVELMLLANLGEKLVLFGDATPITDQHQPFTQTNSFDYLTQHLSPAYRYTLKEQFRLHPELSVPVYRGISSEWIQTQTARLSYHLPQLWHRLLWQDVRNQTEEKRILEFLTTLNPDYATHLGIITFCATQRDWFRDQLPDAFTQLTIGTVSEWAGQECAIALLCCTGNPATLRTNEIKIALTRGQDYLIAFGDYDLWQQLGSPLRHIKFNRERRVALA